MELSRAVARARSWAADEQDGVISRRQALALGLTDHAIEWQLQRGHWQRLHPGVYATFSGELSRRCWLWAAVLRVGPRAVLSHRTAAELWDLRIESSDAVHITVPSGTWVMPISGVVVHYSRRVAVATHPALVPPRTRIEETVLDLAHAADSLDEALALILGACAGRRTTPEFLAAAMRKRPRMRWRASVTGALADAVAGVHSLLEHRYLYRVERGHGLPTGRRQAPTRRGSRRQYSDVAYKKYRTLVELDGRAAHPGEARWRDIRRDNANAADGHMTLRYSWIDVSEHSCEVAQEIARVLHRRGWTGKLRRCGRGCRVRPD
jgi:hypothetical protein